MRPLAKGYILTMFGLGGTVLLWSLSSMPTDRVNWSVFAILAVCAATAQLFPVVTPRNQTYELTPIFVFSGILLLPQSALALLVVLAFCRSGSKARRPGTFSSSTSPMFSWMLTRLPQFQGSRSLS